MLQRFMLINDSVTTAVEVPTYLTKADVAYYRRCGFRLDFNADVITGHVDFLQVRNGYLHILDYKPEAKREKRAHVQLTIYALALSQRANLPLKCIKCAWFDEKDYFEFFPLNVRGHPKTASEGHLKTGHFQEPFFDASPLGCADGQRTENGEERSGFSATEAGLDLSAIERERGVRRETIARYDPGRDLEAARVAPGSAQSVRALSRRDREEAEAGTAGQADLAGPGLRAGFCGSLQPVKRFCRKLKSESPRVFARVATPAGRDMQIDFGKGALTQTESGRYRRPHLFKAVLCHCRHSYEEVVWRQDVETFVRCVENAFRAFGGSVEVVRLDNLKAGITRTCFVDPQVNAVFAALAKHYHFAVLPIHLGSPHENGKVERGVGYRESSALRGRRFESLAEQNQLDPETGSRPHPPTCRFRLPLPAFTRN